mmetsp:Transcript_15127/g.49613  ORF Transcript_15127/g.49613 Transcript_15127/m.49613 type:complete len:203 (-) Transcript_15127:1077-1685(-)
MLLLLRSARRIRRLRREQKLRGRAWVVRRWRWRKKRGLRERLERATDEQQQQQQQRWVEKAGAEAKQAGAEVDRGRRPHPHRKRHQRASNRRSCRRWRTASRWISTRKSRSRCGASSASSSAGRTRPRGTSRPGQAPPLVAAWTRRSSGRTPRPSSSKHPTSLPPRGQQPPRSAGRSSRYERQRRRSAKSCTCRTSTADRTR